MYCTYLRLSEQQKLNWLVEFNIEYARPPSRITPSPPICSPSCLLSVHQVQGDFFHMENHKSNACPIWLPPSSRIKIFKIKFTYKLENINLIRCKWCKFHFHISLLQDNKVTPHHLVCYSQINFSIKFCYCMLPASLPQLAFEAMQLC